MLLAVLRAVNLGVRFLLELAALGSLAWWGATLDRGLGLRVVVAVGAPLAAAVFWGMLVAPNASRRLEDPALFVAEVAVFAAGGLALAVAWRPGAGLALAGAASLTSVLVRLWGGQ